MQHTEGTFQGIDGISLYYQTWETQVKPKAGLVIVHGVAEHSGRYGNLVEGLVPAGFSLYAYDHRGHGRSPGKRGYIRSWSEYRSDLGAFLAKVRELVDDLPLFLFGHSMGALVVLDYILHEDANVNGAIVSAAPIDSSKAASAALIATARLLSSVWPTFPMKSPLNAAHLSCDQQVVDAYLGDPLVFHNMTARWGTEYLDTQAWVRAHAAALNLPILLIHGSADEICLVEGSHWLYERIDQPDKSLNVYPGGFHESHNEPGHDQEIEDIINWLDQRVPVAGS
jgi:alpha-beta hydrolase superfamily lysophospholipase